MFMRTTSRRVTFVHPFSLQGMGATQPAGTYTVETDEELLQGFSIEAYRRVATTIRLPSPSGQTRLDRVVPIDPLELDAAHERDRAEPDVGADVRTDRSV